ncbi:zinc ABC transporter substrate-binding protein [Ferruginivarius sediminum]|uniref:High-affinity zinc uptake system protein ZnuA n=1 Tax=Ferruginivarius sediminum TaxID=2661937 RepID=A0A369T6I0_9PROT|nr:zinc ABC transporter substrate-binding protein [Ferruginivarius sediminum]RDD60931.1 zinc ABC transporter substrate-binding protein [Ferruginivarius sediminum]
MRRLGRIALQASILLAASLTTFGSAAEPSVVASINPVHSLVAGVMQGIGQPRLLVAAGQSPHTYSLRPSEAQALENADLVVWVGPSLEPFLERPVANIARPSASFRLMHVDGLRLLRIREGGTWEGHAHDEANALADEHEHAHEHRHDGEEREHDGHAVQGVPDQEVDPHLWLDPDNALVLVDAIAARLAEVDPANADAYRRNAAEMRQRIRKTEAEAQRIVAPVADIPFVVFHDAYQYFERHYRLNAAGSITLSPDQRAGARRLIEIRAKMAELGARCVFREPQFAPDLVATVIEGTDTRVGELDPLGIAHEPGPEAYPEMLLDLARNLSACLQGES